jgi:hypothetical protein
MKIFKYLIIAALVYFVFQTYMNSKWVPLDQEDLITEDPRQEATGEESFQHKDYKIIPRRTFYLEARVLSKRRYRTGHEANLAPFDLALGWGPMSDDTILKDIKITQSNRWYYYKYKFPPPLAKKEIISHSGNMHLIPANLTILNQIKKVRPGQVVELEGYLVSVRAEDGWRWNSSLSRTDTGSGSCEVVWVEDFYTY